MFVSLRTRPEHEIPVNHNNIVGTLKIHPLHTHIGQAQKLPGAVSPDMLPNTSPLSAPVPEVVNIINQVISKLPFLLNPRSIAEKQS